MSLEHRQAFLALHYRAREAAGAAAATENARLGPEDGRGFDCGFAWVQLTPGNHPFVRALRNAGIGSKHWNKGWELWAGSQLHDEHTQSISVHVAAAEAYAKVIREGVIGGLNVSPDSRYD